MRASSLPPVVCMRAHVLLTIFINDIRVRLFTTTSCLYEGSCFINDVRFVFTTSCLYEGSCFILVRLL